MDRTSMLLSERADMMDLLGPDFDRPAVAPARRTLIICAAPRSGSSELCRYLTAARIGVAHEYFNPEFAYPLARRWALTGNPLGETGLGRYIDVLRRRRSENGVFATKMHFQEFDKFLRNAHGAALFDGACVVHLFRPDVVKQFASFRAAKDTGLWDFSERRSTPAVMRNSRDSTEFLREAIDEMNYLVSEDAGFRCLFVLLSIRPLFVTSDELFADPVRILRRIGEATSAELDEEGLQRVVAASAPYGRDQQRERSVVGLKELFKKIAFSKAASH